MATVSTEELTKRGVFHSSASGMYIVDPDYEKKYRKSCHASKRCCLLLIFVMVIVVIVGGTVGIIKAVQSSESLNSESSNLEEGLCSQTTCSLASSVATGTSSFNMNSSKGEYVSPSKTSYPVPTTSVVIATLWSTWQGWSVCSASCGGGKQTRKRICGNPEKSNVITNCYGNDTLLRNCSSWKCPDCTKPCPVGHLNSACDACICTNVTLKGVVRNEEKVLLDNATIALAEFPFNILARTNSAGHFELRGICVLNEEIIVERSGYLPQTLQAKKINPTMFSLSASLKQIVPPEVRIHPENKVRIEGQTMVLCCAGIAEPEPSYEWIFNGHSVSEFQQDTKKSSKLTISRLHRNMSGEVKCRVYNDYGAEFSNVARITVITKNDSCNGKPLSKYLALPPGCVEENMNSSSVDVGRCGGEKCISSSLLSLQKCSDNYCCQSVAEETVTIRCIVGVQFNVTRIRSCGCGQCSPKKTTIRGVATGPDNVPFKYGYIYHAGKYLTRSGRNGDFSFSMPGDQTRIVLTFKGRDSYNDFQDLTKVVSIVPGSVTFVEVKMRRRPLPILVNSSTVIEIQMGRSGNDSQGKTGPAPVVLSLPPQSLVTEDGEIYNGTANVEVSFADPRNETQVREADGDFTTVSYDGEEQLLETFGVFKLDFKDTNGKQLQPKTDIDVLLDLDEYNITEEEARAIKLWYMDEKTGRWRMMDSGLKQHETRRSKRSGRQFYFGKIDHTVYKLYNFDVISINDCIISIMVNDNSNSVNARSVKITLVSKEGNRNNYNVHYTSTGRATCIRTFCKSLTIQATIKNKVLKPVAKNFGNGIKYYNSSDAFDRFSRRITVDNVSVSTSRGPFFQQMFECYSAVNHLTFEDNRISNSIEISDSSEEGWHDSFDPAKFCLVKIAIKGSCSDNKTVYFHVKSTESGAKNWEGFKIVSIPPSNRSVCAEFKCPPSKRGDVNVTITPFSEGKFRVTKRFEEDLKTGGFKIFVDKVIGFTPKSRHRFDDIGISFLQVEIPQQVGNWHEEFTNKYCVQMNAGITFDCA
ncbi:cartilage intermediate layer protein 1-like [Dendronephthya gigantea]|uniref:cartilage intermediate layer protein 1-like n=1 Tax=Dendronephthya gigantea TaxID=151771 RepID=UPI00106C299E|nr:cartilage intermediate layer protein 1-like [Dendronephthya gigantea]XP_028407617.1 cartilage intermediate layer protein 1-like [Dendronephthya gigantea]